MKLKLAAALGIALGFAAPANAVPIASGSVFNITGSSNFDATTVSFTNPGSVTLGAGDFAAFGTCAGCVTLPSVFTYSPFTPGQIYSATATNGSGLTATFEVTSQVSATYTPGSASSLVIHDLGRATLTGFDTTDGEWVFTANQFSNGTTQLIGSFSATTQSTGGGGGGGDLPEPASLAILGIGLAGLGWAKRRKA